MTSTSLYTRYQEIIEFVAHGEYETGLDEQSLMTVSKGLWNAFPTGLVETGKVEGRYVLVVWGYRKSVAFPMLWHL